MDLCSNSMSSFTTADSSSSSTSSSGASPLVAPSSTASASRFTWKPWVTPRSKGLRTLPVIAMVNKLDAMCYDLESIDQFHKVLADPCSVNRILKYYPNARVKLVKFFQWLEKSKGDFVWELVLGIFNDFDKLANNFALLPFDLDCSSNLRLGTMLMETGWYAESILILNVARTQCGNSLLQKLQVMRVILLAESLSSRHTQASGTMGIIEDLLGQDMSIPINLVVAVHNAISVSFFENCQFELSYQHGHIALQLLSEQQCISSTIVNTYRQMAKCCIAMKRPQQANLLITQALMWARHCFKSTSVYYAEVLEDYAFCLLAQSKNYRYVYENALKIYQEKHGDDFNRPDVAQGNLALGLYIQNIAHRMDEEYLMKNVVDLTNNDRMLLGGSEDRMKLAAKRIKSIVAADKACREMCNPFGDEMDTGLNDRMERQPIAVVQSEFHILNFLL